MKFQKKITLEKKTKFCFIFSFQKSPKKNLPTQHFFPTFERVAAAWWRNDAPTKSCHYLPLPTQRAVRVCICAFLVRTKKNDGRRCAPKWKQSHPLRLLLLLRWEWKIMACFFSQTGPFFVLFGGEGCFAFVLWVGWGCVMRIRVLWKRTRRWNAPSSDPEKPFLAKRFLVR